MGPVSGSLSQWTVKGGSTKQVEEHKRLKADSVRQSEVMV